MTFSWWHQAFFPWFRCSLNDWPCRINFSTAVQVTSLPFPSSCKSTNSHRVVFVQHILIAQCYDKTRQSITFPVLNSLKGGLPTKSKLPPQPISRDCRLVLHDSQANMIWVSRPIFTPRYMSKCWMHGSPYRYPQNHTFRTGQNRPGRQVLLHLSSDLSVRYAL